ncbi:MtrAB system accessory lipoprotein LpqB [Mariniluteicoccus endophyticus]
MMSTSPARLARFCGLVMALLLCGCTQIPVAGPVVPADGPARVPEVSVEISADPPRPGATPGMIVNGYLQAMSTYQQGYATARLFLAPEVRDAWRPEDGVTVYADGYGVTSAPESAVLEAPVVGRVGADGAYENVDEKMRLDFGMVRDESGEWRIGRPPPGIVISQYLFGRFYQRVNTYFYDPEFSSLVPDPIFLPRGPQLATPMLQALLRGPTGWIRPVVVSAIPTQARLNVQSASIDSRGVVEVSLNQAVAGLADDQRSRAAAQIVWTLGQLDGVTGVRLTVDGQPWAVKEQVQGVIPVGAYSWLDPIPTQRSPQLYGATATGVVRINDTSRGVELTPVAGPLGGQGAVRWLAAAPAGDRLAAVTDDGGTLWDAPIGETAAQRVLVDYKDLLRPQWVGTGAPQLWAIGDQGGTQDVRVLVNSKPVNVAAPAFAGARVRAFRLSPDGVRMAAILERDGRLEVGLARVDRAGPEPVVEEWRPLRLGDVPAEAPRAPVDVSWTDATTLMVLAADDPKQPARPYRVDQNAFEVAIIGQPDSWQATQLVTAPRNGAARALVVGARGVWRYDEDYRWPMLTRDVTTAAYA